MNIVTAINRIKWRIECGGWKANENDYKAIDGVIDFFNHKQFQQFKNHELFAKLYIYSYISHLDYYKSTVFDDIPRKELNKLLEKPIEYFIDRFTDKLNDDERIQLFSELKITDNHPVTKSEQSKKEELKRLKEAIKSKSNSNRFYGKVWNTQNVEKAILSQINNFLYLYYGRQNN